MPLLSGVIASQISGRLWSGPQGAYEALNSVTLSSSAASVTFSGIPTGYKHLQIRTINKVDAGTPDLWMRFNNDEGTNYKFHILRGAGSGSVTAEAYTAASITNPVSTYFQTSIIDILDYNSTSKLKNSKIFVGRDNNGGGEVGIWSHLWTATPQAITSITFIPNTAVNISASSTFALYGVR
jgi:hypothetical protein